MVGAQTRVFGIIGQPLGHTLSPAIHNAAFEATGFDGVYVALPVAPEGLADAVSAVRAFKFGGLSVTVPHKVAITALLDGLTAEAEAAGAVNTVFWEGGRLLGHNTDVAGYAAMLDSAGRHARQALVLGAGGAARAVCLALRRAGIPTTVAAREPARAVDLIVPGSVAVTRWEAAGSLLGGTGLLVNTTPVGMHPDGDSAPLGDLAALPAGAIVHDLVYRPLETRLLAMARGRGLDTVDGGVMLVRQAAEAFRLWTGLNPPEEAMRAAFDRES
jgi:shikimate dehydrogenase